MICWNVRNNCIIPKVVLFGATSLEAYVNHKFCSALFQEKIYPSGNRGLNWVTSQNKRVQIWKHLDPPSERQLKRNIIATRISEHWFSAEHSSKRSRREENRGYPIKMMAMNWTVDCTFRYIVKFINLTYLLVGTCTGLLFIWRVYLMWTVL